MTNINQDFSDTEIETIINNATEKTIIANSKGDYDVYHPPEAWCIIVIILYTIAAVLELFRYWQTWNKLHLVLFMPAILVVSAYAAELTVSSTSLFMIEGGLFFFAVANWMTIMTLTYLLFIWVRSMFGCLPARFSQHFFRFVQAYLALFTLTALARCIIYAIYMDKANKYRYDCGSDEDYCIQKLNECYEMLIIPSAIETSIICILELFYIVILRKFPKVIDQGLILKRRQLIWLMLMYLAQLVYSVCSLAALAESLEENLGVLQLFVGSVQAYICISVLFVYFILTIFPREAITGFDKVPGLPTIVQDEPIVAPNQPAVAPGLPTVVTGLPTFVPDQPTIVKDQPTVVSDQPTVTTGRLTFVTDQITVMPDQPTSVTGQLIFTPDQSTVISGRLTFMTDQLTIIPGQTTFATSQLIFMPDQPTAVSGQSTVALSQPTLVKGRPTVVADRRANTKGRLTFVTDQFTVMPGQPTSVTGQLNFVTDQPTVITGRLTFVTDQLTIVPDQTTFATSQLIFVTD
jgi:hypothetical protein